MLNIGLTGGIAAGKSEAASRFAAHGAIVIDADRLAREVVAPGTPGHAAVVQAFGPTVISNDATLDRGALASLVFADETARTTLNAIIHPLVAARTAELMAAAAPDDIVIHDVPLLVENDLMHRYDSVVVIQAPLSARLARLARRGLTPAEAQARIQAQTTDSIRAAAATHLITNDGDLANLHTQVDKIWQTLQGQALRQS